MEKRIINRALMFVASEVVCVWQLISGEFGGVHVRCSRSGGGKSAPRWQRRACTKLQRRWGGHSTPLVGGDAHRRRNDKAPGGIGQGCRSDSDNSGSLGRRWAGLGWTMDLKLECRTGRKDTSLHHSRSSPGYGKSSSGFFSKS